MQRILPERKRKLRKARICVNLYNMARNLHDATVTVGGFWTLQSTFWMHARVSMVKYRGTSNCQALRLVTAAVTERYGCLKS